MGNQTTEARGRLRHLNAVILIAFAMISVALVYWTVVRGPSILGRADNPRLVEAELRIQRGTILDANNQPLALTRGQDDSRERHYPLPAAAPIVGYYSIRHGTAGIEEAFDSLLRGEGDGFWDDFWRSEVLGEPQSGGDVRLTLDSRWQGEAERLLGERTGAVVLFSIPDVAILAMASTPGYDPNQLDADFDQLLTDEQAPLLNRVTQGQYQPGLLLQPFLLAAAQRDGIIEMADAVTGADKTVMVDGEALHCQAELPQAATWGDVLSSRCPGPMVELAGTLADDSFVDALAEFGLLDAPVLEIAAEGNEGLPIADAELAAIGQDILSVSPMQLALALATLANDGRFKPAQLVLARQARDGQWENLPGQDEGQQVVPGPVAREILGHFAEHEGLAEHGVIVLSGPDSGSNSWYLGLAPATDPRYGVIAVVEDESQISSSTTIGRTLLKQVLDPES